MSEDHRSEQRFDDSELLEMTEQDPAQARLLRQSLEHLSSGRAGDALKEMAQDVLAGRAGLRESVEVSAYSDQLFAQAAPMVEKWAALSEEERDALAAQGERQLAEERERAEAEQREALKESAKKSRHDGRGWSVY
ncbi:hypothetical protein P8605_14615 [Streptomyces sp. T-3]|nr:hypothetical protein [Streptomyces sp. T-3]